MTMSLLYLVSVLLLGPDLSFATSPRTSRRQAYGSLQSRCNANIFQSLEFPSIEILNVETETLLNYTVAAPNIPGLETIIGPIPPPLHLNMCNVTVTYTHPGWNDAINVNNLLPLDNWNERFLANGGGGFSTGSATQLGLDMLLMGTSEYALSTTDGGHKGDPSKADPWPLTSPGNLNWPLLVDFASVSLGDMVVIGKSVTRAFYSTPPKYSYFIGGSTGGRQGHMLAQRYPEELDGIIGYFPAVYWNRLMASLAWPVFKMDQLGYYPPACELSAITAGAIQACDGLDGVEDGIISYPDHCDFQAVSMVGQQVPCGLLNSTIVITEKGAQIMQAAWDGPRTSDGEFQWFGYNRGAQITGPAGVAGTSCDSTKTVCDATPFSIPFDWATWFVKKDPNYIFRNVTHKEWDAITHQTIVEYASIIDTDDTDLTRLKEAGTKLLTWHGTVDPLIPTNSTSYYYDRVSAKQPDVQDYYRYYIAPGAGHSEYGGIAPPSSSVLMQMRDWVEKGVAPEVLHAKGRAPDGREMERDLCLYPKVQHYTGGDFTRPESYICV